MQIIISYLQTKTLLRRRQESETQNRQTQALEDGELVRVKLCCRYAWASSPWDIVHEQYSSFGSSRSTGTINWDLHVVKA